LSGNFERRGPGEVDAVLVDAGAPGDDDLPAWPHADLRSIVLVTPSARGKLDQLRAKGFSAYLIKPVRQASLADRIRACDVTDMPAADSARPVSAPSVPTARPIRILLAEDNPVNAMVTREMLIRRGHAVHEVTSGEDAIAAMADGGFDLVLTDIHMPGLDGIEATKRIRRNEFMARRPRTPIIALTADVLETGRQACQDVGMDGFLTKPIDPAELDAMIAKLFPGEPRTEAA
jgi:CheY-like chemotaxis protein